MKKFFLKSWLVSLMGLILLVPASYFMITLCMKIFLGSTRLYYAIAPSFMESGSDIFPLHKSNWILYGPLIAVILNAAIILRIRFRITTVRCQVNVLYRRYWLNTAIAFQSFLLFVVLVAYLIIQHIRY